MNQIAWPLAGLDSLCGGFLLLRLPDLLKNIAHLQRCGPGRVRRVWVQVCVCVCVYTYMVYMHVCTHTHTHTYIYTAYTYIHINMQYMHIYMYIRIYADTYVCIPG